MHALLLRADGVLRRRPLERAGAGGGALELAGLVAAFGVVYGAAMGSYALANTSLTWSSLATSLQQMIFSAIKVPLLLLATFVLSLPSFFVINSLLGLRRDFAESVRALVATQAGLSVVLASFAPLTLVWYASSSQYGAAVLFNALMFGMASFIAQWVLRGYYTPLIERNVKHRWMLRAWLVVYAFVGIQMGWVLRPFIGDPSQPVQFFRSESWGNAYVIVGKMIWRAIHG